MAQGCSAWRFVASDPIHRASTTQVARISGPCASRSAPLRLTEGWARQRARRRPRGVSWAPAAVEIVIIRAPGYLCNAGQQREVQLVVRVNVQLVDDPEREHEPVRLAGIGRQHPQVSIELREASAGPGTGAISRCRSITLRMVQLAANRWANDRRSRPELGARGDHHIPGPVTRCHSAYAAIRLDLPLPLPMITTSSR